MHSRKKRVSEPTEEEKQAEKARLQKIQDLHSQVFERYRAEDYSEEALELVRRAISVSPDVYSFFNYRRKLLLTYLTEENSQKLLEKELDMLIRAIKESPKSYTLWYHRQWILERCRDFSEVMAKELALCEMMLTKDHRNFHCWNYRTWVIKLQELPLDSELEFTKTMINRDFSNFSAWHYRSKLLKIEYPNDIPVDFLDKEFNTLKNGYFTCPNDQSIWSYHRWLMQQVNPIQITGISPCTYEEPPDFFIVGFTHKVGHLDDSSIAVSDGWEPLKGNWTPCLGKNFSYIWKFTPDSKPKGNVEIRMSPVNATLKDINGFKKLSSVIFKFQAEGTQKSLTKTGSDDVSLIQKEIAGINELLEIEEDDIVQPLLRKAQLLEQTWHTSSQPPNAEEVTAIYEQLIRIDSRHTVFYNEILEMCKCLTMQREPESPIVSHKLLANLVGIISINHFIR